MDTKAVHQSLSSAIQPVEQILEPLIINQFNTMWTQWNTMHHSTHSNTSWEPTKTHGFSPEPIRSKTGQFSSTIGAVPKSLAFVWPHFQLLTAVVPPGPVLDKTPNNGPLNHLSLISVELTTQHTPQPGLPLLLRFSTPESSIISQHLTCSWLAQRSGYDPSLSSRTSGHQRNTMEKYSILEHFSGSAVLLTGASG